MGHKLKHSLIGVVIMISVLCGSNMAFPFTSSTSSERLVCTYYFYWYDIYSGYHVVDSDGTDELTDHPPDEYLSDFSFKEISWHKRELLDMIAAGIDIVLPVYWGSDEHKFWSFEGLNTLVKAQQELISDGYNPPKIGMFFDTTSLQHQNDGQPIDLTTDYGKATFYQMIKDFYSIIPTELWAEIDEQPIVWLWLFSTDYASAYNQETFDYLDICFQSDFNGKIPYVVRESSWEGVITANSYSWGAAVEGPTIRGIASIGPGFDDSAVRDRSPHTFRDRENGQFYKDSWQAAIDSGRRIVVIETWNEFHEASEICNSKECGKQYIDITKDYINRFKSWPDYTDEPLVWDDLGTTQIHKGLIISTSNPDGAWRVAEKSGKEAAYADNNTDPPSYYIYFDVNDDFIHASETEIWIQVEYFDEGFDTFTLEYDSNDPFGGPFGGAYTTSDVVILSNTKQWKIHTFYLKNAYFGGRQNWDSDFRLFDNVYGTNYFNRVWVYKYNPDEFPTPSPAAKFISNNNSGIKPLTIEFIDLSTGYIDSWLWYFGDGGTSTEQNPLYTYTTTDDYSVSLMVTGPGGSDIETKTNYIHVNEPTPAPTPIVTQEVGHLEVISPAGAEVYLDGDYIGD
jgi:PKD repeat protein